MVNIFDFFWPPKITNPCSKQPIEHDGDFNKSKFYDITIHKLYVKVNSKGREVDPNRNLFQK